MPIFMFVSGYFAWDRKKKAQSRNMEHDKKTVVSLSCPFLSYAIVISLITRENIVFYSIITPQKSPLVFVGTYVDATY